MTQRKLTPGTIIASTTDGNVRADLEWIGEGRQGDYDPADPDDEPLLRFAVYLHRGRRWGYPEDAIASWCTLTPATIPARTARALTRLVAATARRAIESRRSLGATCVELSYLHPDWLRRRRLPFRLGSLPKVTGEGL